jgi:phage FluMu protein Com
MFPVAPREISFTMSPFQPVALGVLMLASPTLLARIRAEFSEMPGLKLTMVQACRLWNVSEHACRDALDTLTRERFLFETPSGAFVALPSATRMLKVDERAARPSRCPYCQHLNSVQIERTITGSHASATFRCSACGKIVAANFCA